MDLVRSLVMAGLLVSLVGCRSDTSTAVQEPQAREPIRIQLDGSNPAASEGVLDRAEGPLRFTVGHGRHGIGCEGTTFEEGVTPLGTFEVNAILSDDRFAQKRILKPLFCDESSFATLVAGMDQFGGTIAQALGSIAPFAAQLFHDKNVHTERVQRALPGMHAGNMDALMRAAAAHLVANRWGLNDAKRSAA